MARLAVTVTLAPLALLALLALLPASQVDAAPRESFKKNDFKLEYRAMLGRFAAGQDRGALDDLLDLEQRMLADRGAKLDQIWKAKLSVIRDLLSAGPDVLVPLSQLHEGAYLLYIERGNHALAAHSRLMTIELAELYAERVRGSRGERMASAVITSIAGYLQASSMDTTASALYRRAAELDPDNDAALLGLAGIFERHGDYEEALKMLSGLAERGAESSEGKLRRAVQLIRMERAPEAEVALRELVSPPDAVPSWLLSLGYQEWVRLLIARGDFETAGEVAARGTQELSGDPTLAILESYVADRRGTPTDKSDLSAALMARNELEASPRYRYSQMPREALGLLRTRLSGESDSQRELLAEALSAAERLATAGSR